MTDAPNTPGAARPRQPPAEPDTQGATRKSRPERAPRPAALRIVFLLPCLPTGPVGGVRVVYEYANRLVARGHDVAVAEPRLAAAATSFAQRARGYAVGALRLALGPIDHWQWLDPRVRRLRVPSLDPRFIPDADAIVATAWRTAEYLHSYPPTKGGKFYLIQGYETWSGPKARVDATWRLPLRKIVIARWLENLGRELGAGEMVCIPNAINPGVFRIARPIGDRPKSIAMMISHIESKGTRDGVSALKMVRDRHPDVDVLLFGKVPFYWPRPRRARYRWNPPRQVLVNDIYNASRIFVCPSWQEGFGLPGAEAMACGCALASTDCLGVREYARHGENALLSPPRDAAALAANILALLADDTLRQHLARAGAATMRGFCWEDRAARLEAVLSSAAPTSPAQPHQH